MKRKMFFGIALLLCVFLVAGVASAGLDLSGEFTYDMDTETSEGSTETVATLGLGPVDFVFTWGRTWLPSISDSLKLNVGVTAGVFALNYEKELLEPDAGIATLSLKKGIAEVKYARQLDGIDSGALTTTLTLTPLILEWVRDFDEDALGTIKLSFSKSF